MIGEIIRFGRLLARDRWSAPRLAEYRRSRLRRLVRHAYDRVPYYRDLMRGAGIAPDDIRDFPDLAQIPISTKAMLREAGDALLARDAGPLLVRRTSGTSGHPFAVHRSPAEHRDLRLREFRMLMHAGVRPRDRLVLLGPTTVRPQRLHRRLGFYRMEVISCTLHHDELTARFLRTRPDVLWFYPSSLKTVLQVSGARLGDLVRPRFLIASAQVLDEPFRRRIGAELPGVPILDIYGSCEAGRIAATRDCGHGMHVEEDAVHVELLDGGVPVERGALGTVTVTVLDQLAMPFIRYEQGDFCRERLDDCGCGRPTARLDPPIGRNANLLTLPDGRRVAAAILDLALRDEAELLQYRFVQTSPVRVRVELCYRRAPTQARLDAIGARLRALTSPDIDYALELFPAFRMQETKFRVFVSELEAAPAAAAQGTT